jgi:hypothetical protein
MIEFANSKRKPKMKWESKIEVKAIEAKKLWASAFLIGHFIMKYSLT